MPIAATCPGCRKNYQVAESAAGKTVRCKACGVKFKVPRPEPAQDDDALFAELIGDESEAEDSDQAAPGDEFGAWRSSQRPSDRRANERNRPTRRRPAASGSSRTVKWIAVGLGGVGLVVLLCCGAIALFFGLTKTGPACDGEDGVERRALPAYG